MIDDDDDISDLLAERRGRRAYMRELAQHPDSRDPDHPEPIDEGTEADRVAADLAYNRLKDTGELQRRETDRALAEQVRWEAP